MHLRRTSPWTPLLGFFAAGAVLTAIAARARADEIRVPLDQAQMRTFDKPMRTVSIGNPAIADITVIDRTHILILGKSFGATNIIALDSFGHEALNEQVIVTGRPGGTVTVQRGIQRSTLVCTPEHCEGAPTPGDELRAFTNEAAQGDKLEAEALRAAGGK